MLKFNVNGLGEVKVYASFKGEHTGKYVNKKNYKFQILIVTRYGKAYFTFHDSYYNYCYGRKTLNKAGIMNAVDCILADVYDYINDEIEGIYDDDPKEAARVMKGCKKMYNSLQRIVGDYSIDEFNEAFEKIYNQF